MQQSQVMEDKVISIVKAFARSINSEHKAVQVDMSALIEMTSQLSLTRFSYWEDLIRSEFSFALRESMPPKWKRCFKPNERLTWLDLISWNGYKREKNTTHFVWSGT